MNINDHYNERLEVTVSWARLEVESLKRRLEEAERELDLAEAKLEWARCTRTPT